MKMMFKGTLTIASCLLGSTFALAQTEAPRLPPAPRILRRPRCNPRSTPGMPR